MREKGIDGHHAEADSLELGNQPGSTPFVNASAFSLLINLDPRFILGEGITDQNNKGLTTRLKESRDPTTVS